MKRVFLDTNVVLDYLLAREPWDAQAALVWAAIAKGSLSAWVSSITLLNVAYIARKSLDNQTVKSALEDILNAMEVVAVGDEEIRAALASDVTDFEDAVQHECALSAGVECILSRDLTDYKYSQLPVHTPNDFAAQYITLP